MQKKILHLDMDGVLADFVSAIKALSPNTDLQFYSKEVDDICAANPYIFHTLPPIEGAIEAVKELFDLADVYFLSSPMAHVALSYAGKRVWLHNHFGDIAERKLILTHRKDLVMGDILVDDTDRNGAGEFKGIRIHFATEQFPDWKTTLPYLKHLLRNMSATEYLKNLQR